MKKKFRFTALSLVVASVVLTGASCVINLGFAKATWLIDEVQGKKAENGSEDSSDSKRVNKQEWAAGKSDSALSFGGTNQHVEINNPMNPPEMTSNSNLQSTTIVSLDGEWLLAIDPQDIGREQDWYTGPVPESKPTKVPWIVQEAFPGYFGGVAWYWRDFQAPANPHEEGRYLLRFWTVSYKSDIWVNDVFVGEHEGGEDVFVLDVTEAIQPMAINQIAVRVLNPTEEPIDGIVRGEIPQMGLESGILDSVELLVAPAVRIENLFVLPDPKTGDIHIQVTARNTRIADQYAKARGDSSALDKVNLEFTVAPATSGETLDAARVKHDLPPGDTLIDIKLNVKDYQLWELNAPFLYRVTVRARLEGPNSFDEQSTRCGTEISDLKMAIFASITAVSSCEGALAMPVTPISGRVPYDPNMLRLDLLQLK